MTLVQTFSTSFSLKFLYSGKHDFGQNSVLIIIIIIVRASRLKTVDLSEFHPSLQCSECMML